MWWLLSAKGIETFAGHAGFDMSIPIKDIVNPTHQVIVNGIHRWPIHANPNVAKKSWQFSEPPWFLDERELQKNDGWSHVYDRVWWFDSRGHKVKSNSFVPNMKGAEENFNRSWRGEVNEYGYQHGVQMIPSVTGTGLVKESKRL